MVEECTSLENFLQHSSSGGGAQGFYRTMQFREVWVIWKRRVDHV